MLRLLHGRVLLGLALVTFTALLMGACSGDRGGGSLPLAESPDSSSPVSPESHPAAPLAPMSPFASPPADASRSVVQGVTRVELVKATLSPPFAQLPNATPTEERPDHEPMRPKRWIGGQAAVLDTEDPVAQGHLPIVSMPLAANNFHGQGTTLSGHCAAGSCATPPDPNGAVGPNHYVQVTNEFEGLAIWNKNTGALLSGPKQVNTLWSAFAATDPCRTRNDGDPVVVYDGIADRWFITQFSLPNEAQTTANTGPSYQCVAVSQTPDPTGAYYLYEFSYPYTINDYGKFGIWEDAYYATFDMFGGKSGYMGADFCAYDRSKMLTGAAATQQCFFQAYTAPNCPGANQPFAVFGALPVSLEGQIPPPNGEPGYFLQFDYSQCTAPYNQLDLWNLHIDFTTPANSKLTGPTALTVANFTPTCYASTTGFPNCVPQPGSTVTLDALDDRVMFRLAYRNFGKYESIVVNHAVVGGGGKGGPTNTGSAVRWYELQMQPGGTNPTVAQQSTYAPNDANWRWMASIAQDQANDMALGYAISSNGAAGAVTFPSLGWTGRINTDPVSTMNQGETILDVGSIDEGDAYPAGGGQPDEHRGRWGDYSNMTIDPSDDCTFWYTQELYDVTGVAGPVGNWDTYIASTKFPNCAQNDFTIAVAPATQNVADGGSVNYTVTTAVKAGTAETITLWVQNLPTGVTGSFNPASVTTGGTSTLTLTASATAPVTGAPAPTFMVIGKATSAVHSATAQIAVVACGGAGQLCCPTGTACTNSGDVCSGGTCVACGATSEPCCTGNACAAGDNCAGGTCVACGATGQPCCSPSNTCTSTGDVCSGGTCALCGGTGQPCCAGSACTGGDVCSGGSCAVCGGLGQPCCTGNTCNSGEVCGSGGTCGSCGAAGQPCCAGNACAAGDVCSGGQCLACGAVSQPCCAGNACNAGEVCATGTCAACGGAGQACCAGNTCTAAHQTCGGGGAPGVCGCTAATTCPGGQNCNTAPDGCGGTIMCGTCVAPQSCGGGGNANQCGCTSTMTCIGGQTCGTGMDNCGNALSCGTCTLPQTCGGGGTAGACGCTPTTCAQQGAQCGTIADECGGTLTCPSCANGESCVSNQCVGGGADAGADSGATDAGATDSGATDSGATDSGARDSGATDAGMSSDACTPTTCAFAFAECGTIPDTCGGTLDCGSCLGGDVCVQNQCVAATDAGSDGGMGITPPDAGPPDAGRHADAAPVSDASGDAAAAESGDTGGCGCRTVETGGSSSSGFLAFGAVGLGVAARMRRRRRPRS